MENKEIENVDSQNDTEATENATEEEVESTESEGGTEVDIEAEIEAEVKKQTAILYKRMKQAEAEAKEAKARLSKTSGGVNNSDLSTKDLYALMEAKVPADDIEEVREYALLKKISIAEALKAPIIKSILSEKAEQRKVASASNTGGSRRVSSKISDEALMDNFKKGILPESDDDIQRLVQLRSKK